MRKEGLKAVDFFCSGGGMTCGLKQAGVQVIAGIDNDVSCKETYETNNPGSRFILADVFDLKEIDLKKMLDLKRNDDALILVGCSPCQYWSIIRTDKTRSKKSKNLLIEFKRFVDYFNPGYVLVENVPGILGQKTESGLDRFITDLENRSYRVHFGIVNMNEYGIPQSRRRFSLLATRLHNEPIFPSPDARRRPTLREFIGEDNGFRKIGPGHRDLTPLNHSTAQLSEKNVRRLSKTRQDGGSRSDWAQEKELKRLRYRGNAFPDNYGRMSWNKPAPTITTRFHSISNGRFAHPVQNRGLSIREGAVIQTFPRDYIFPRENIGVAARIIGNAVPPLFARRLGKTIIAAHDHRRI